MAVADAIADLVLAVDLAKTISANWTGTYAAKLAAMASPTEDDYGRLARAAKDVVGGWRPRFVRMLDEVKTDLVAPILDDIAREIARSDVPPGSPPERILGVALRDWMVDNATVFESRAVTHNAASSITSPLTSGADGVLIMHGTDDQATPDDLEAITSDTLRFECVKDQGMGRKSGSELFQVRGGSEARDLLEYGSISRAYDLSAINAGTCAGITNGNLESTLSGTGTDKVPAWTFSSGQGNVAAEATTVFRGSQSLALTGAMLMKQKYASLPANRPVLYGLRYQRSTGSGAGSLDIRIGGVETTVSALSGAGAGWNHSYGIAWPKRFSGSGFDVEIELDATGEAISGTTYIDEIVVHPLTRIGGRYFLLLAGATDFARGDYFTQASSITGTGLIKDWLHKWFGNRFELPHAGTATVGWTDPT